MPIRPPRPPTSTPGKSGSPRLCGRNWRGWDGRIWSLARRPSVTRRPSGRNWIAAFPARWSTRSMCIRCPEWSWAVANTCSGHFMSKELALKDFRDFCRAAQAFAKPCVPDEDNAASMYRDPVGWTIHRKRAWTALLSQCHYDYIDFSITVGSETGTRESNRMIRTWIKHLSDFMQTIDFVHAHPRPHWIVEKPPHVVDSALALPGGEYVAYLADDREVDDPTAGQRISGRISVHLPAGRYLATFFRRQPASTRRHSLGSRDKPVVLQLAPFEHDVVLRVTREP